MQQQKHTKKESNNLFKNNYENEISHFDFHKPLGNWRTACGYAQLYDHLISGGDEEIQCRATRISFAKADAFALFVIKFCQFRPGKSRNARLDGVLMKNIPLYICYGGLMLFVKMVVVLPR